MPGCVFTARGTNFDPDPFLATSKLNPYSVWHRGDQRCSKETKFGGFSCDVSTREALPGQVEDAIAFLNENSADLGRFALLPEVEWRTLDFSYDMLLDGNFFFTQSEYLPPELLRLCGEFNIGIEMSIYAPGPGEFKVVWPPGKCK